MCAVPVRGRRLRRVRGRLRRVRRLTRVRRLIHRRVRGRLRHVRRLFRRIPRLRRILVRIRRLRVWRRRLERCGDRRLRLRRRARRRVLRLIRRRIGIGIRRRRRAERRRRLLRGRRELVEEIVVVAAGVVAEGRRRRRRRGGGHPLVADRGFRPDARHRVRLDAGRVTPEQIAEAARLTLHPSRFAGLLARGRGIRERRRRARWLVRRGSERGSRVHAVETVRGQVHRGRGGGRRRRGRRRRRTRLGRPSRLRPGRGPDRRRRVALVLVVAHVRPFVVALLLARVRAAGTRRPRARLRRRHGSGHPRTRGVSRSGSRRIRQHLQAFWERQASPKIFVSGHCREGGPPLPSARLCHAAAVAVAVARPSSRLPRRRALPGDARASARAARGRSTRRARA